LHKENGALPSEPREGAGTPGSGVLLFFLGMVRGQTLLGTKVEEHWGFVFLLLMCFIV